MKNKPFFAAAALGIASVSAFANSPYLSEVYDFHPAPGQFVNLYPEYEAGDSYAAILEKVKTQLCGDERPGLISLGAYGGYVTVGFDHPVVNKPGEYDFIIYGNAFISNRSEKAGSCEPGIILVSIDANGDGVPNDEWFEIKGSEYDRETTLHDYAITYYKPEADHTPSPDPDDKHVTDTEYIRWTSNDESRPEGWIPQTDYHTQDYWPLWLDAELQTLEFSGECIASNSKDINGDGSYYLLTALGEGYVDNLPFSGTDDLKDHGVKIDWAVNADGTPANLAKVDFIRVYTALNQTCGSLGETSTEVCGGEDLHPNEELSVEGISRALRLILLPSARGELRVRSGLDSPAECALYSASGMKAATFTLLPGDNRIALSELPSGIYLLAAPGEKPVKVAL